MTDGDAPVLDRCQPYADELPELALGILPGRDRARVLAHVDACAACRGELDRLVLAADSILAVVPPVEPPVGFETRLFARLGTGPGSGSEVAGRRFFGNRSRVRRRYRQAALVVASLLLFGAAGAGTEWIIRPGTSVAGGPGGRATGARLASAPLVRNSVEVGEVYVYAGRPAWVFMTIHDGDWSGAVRCEVRVTGGRTVRLGSFWMSGGHGSWGVTLPGASGASSLIVSAAVVTTGGTVLATARFSGGAPGRAGVAAPAAAPEALGTSW